MKKNCQIHIPITSEQKEQLEKKAQIASMNLTQYCRFILFNAEPKVEIEEKIKRKRGNF